MEKLGEKIKHLRIDTKTSQEQLAEAVGVTTRSISAYESGRAVPRANTLRKLAKALNVTVEYLTNDDSRDPEAGRLREEKLDTVREYFGNSGAKEMADLLDRNMAFLAGGDVDQEAKDVFFDALMTAYITCKNEARQKFTPKGKRSDSETPLT